MTLWRLSAAVAFILFTLSQLRLPASDNDIVLESAEVFTDGDALLVPLRIKGKEYLCMLDSGSTSSVYDVSLPLGTPKGTVTATTPDGEIPVRLYDFPSPVLGKTALKGYRLVAGTNLSCLREITGHDIHAVIGMDVLSHYVLRVDFDQGKVLLQRSAGTPRGQRVALTFPLFKKAPHIHVQLSGWDRPLSFLLDTGMSGNGVIRREILKELAKSDKAKRVCETLSITLAGSSPTSVWEVSELSFDQRKYSNLLFREGPGNALGLDFLFRYIITFDFPNRVAYFERSKNFDHPQRTNLTGLRLCRREGKTWVHSVAKEGFAARAGIKANDRLIKVHETNADTARLRVLDQLLGNCQKSISLVILRDGKQIPLSLQPGDSAAEPMLHK